jgi:two-component system, OmpR family, response regulator
MEASKILIVDDDSATRNLIQRFLMTKSYQVESAPDGKTALSLFEQFSPHLVILDINLPDISGYTLCQDMQKQTGVFVLMLTSRNDEADMIQGLNQGADDYITKPFSLAVLESKVGAILKRQRSVVPAEQQSLVFGGLTIDPVRHEVKLYDQIIPFTALEFNLLHCLAKSPGKVFKRAELIQEVWDYDYVGDQRVVDVHIGQIRSKLEIDTSQPAFVQTVRGVGYKFEPPPPSPLST